MDTHKAAMTILLVIKFISVILGIFSNTVVIVVRGSNFIRRRKLSSYHFIILQIAIADLTFAILSSFEVETQHQKWNWQHSLSACRLIKPMQATAADVPGLLMFLLAFERYRGITKSLTHHLRTRVIALIALCIWIFTYIAHLPNLITMKVYEEGNCHMDFKRREKWSPYFDRIYTLLSFFLFWVIPLLGTSLCHCRIYYFIKKHVKRMLVHRQDTTSSATTSDLRLSVPQSPGDEISESPFSIEDNEEHLSNDVDDDDEVFRRESNNNLQVARIGSSIRKIFRQGSSMRERLRQRYRMFRTRTNQKRLKIHFLFAITVAFLVCFFPKRLLFIFSAFKVEFDIKKLSAFIHIVSAAFVYLHCFINSIIYSLVDMKFRREAFLIMKSIIYRKPFYRESFQMASSRRRSSQLHSSVVVG